MGIKSVLGKGLAVVGAAGPAFGPWGAIAAVAANAAISAETKHGAGKGAVKREEAVSRLGDSAPLIAQTVSTCTGHTLQDPEMLRKGLEQMNEATVAIMNAFGMLAEVKKDGPK